MKKILIIDDDATTREYLKQILLAENYQVETCCDVYGAENAILKQNFDLILSDINLAEGPSGFDFLKAFRNTQVLTKFTLISGRNSENDVNLAVKLGVDDYLVKPIDSELLRAKIYRLLHEEDKGKLFFSQKNLNNTPTNYANIFISKICEEGMVLQLSKKMEINSKLKIYSRTFDELGIRAPWFRINSCVNQGEKYLASVSFVGMAESEVQKIRAFLVQHPDRPSYANLM